jgi:hypothetical protein
MQFEKEIFLPYCLGVAVRTETITSFGGEKIKKALGTWNQSTDM